ncbi:APC family permease [Massilia pseudoviolaceinigra]|uniref:APC family permease n=1 Tax=Massilia pseudoviolaceinigra TaxID=3057165 RepID=UPI002796C701|nr:amino acid permease [Massilia sp. CCM 9206]MDQ1920075.1 amino acid permease [Massilia sp. CCM 9206]
MPRTTPVPLVEPAKPAAAAAPRPVIGPAEAIALTVGVVVGAGIFKAPSLVAGMTGSAPWMFAAWALGGLMSLIGALCYAELSTAYASAGGDYHFLQRAYGRPLSFLFAWARFSVIATGSIALLGFVFGDYLNQLLPLGPAGPACYAAAAIVVLSWLNLRSVRGGTAAQAWLTAVEVGGLLLIVCAALALSGDGAAPVPAPGPAAAPTAASFGLAMVFVLLTYGGWNEAAYLSAELVDAKRNMVRVLVISLLAITALYLLVTWAYWSALGMAGMGRSEALAADLLHAAFGRAGAAMISLIVAIAALTSINATIIVGARSSYAAGRDWPALARLGVWDGRRGTPANALRIQCAAALLLVLAGAWTGSGFKAMVEFSAPVFWLFFLLAGVSLFVLRVREPHVARPFKVPLFPLLPLLFCAMCAYMLWASLSYVYNQSLGGWNAAWIGVAVLLAGCLVLPLLHRPGGAPPP